MSSDTEVAVYLTEFERLREEVDNRTEISGHLILGQVAALGTAVSLMSTLPDVMLGVAAVSCFLWLFWLDQTKQVYKIATYIGTILAPELRRYAGEHALGWETYLRRLDAGLVWRPSVSSGGVGSGTVVRAPATVTIGRYTGVLFGGASAIALLVYATMTLATYLPPVVSYWRSAARPDTTVDYLGVLRCAGVGTAVALLGFTITRFREFQTAVAAFDELLVRAAQAAADSSMLPVTAQDSEAAPSNATGAG
jgi:hypothetical protein